jgi:L-alanine-DL-glutamate epimerase-like enolase superfamily enzyme
VPFVLRSVEPIVVSLPRDVPYLGPLGPGESVNARGYVVRRGNRTIYPTVDRSVLVRATTRDGQVGWGETYGIVAPGAVVEMLRDVIVPVIEGRTVDDPAALYEELYDLMRVRGASGGCYGDALAAVDIALWDLAARSEGVSLAQRLGGARRDRLRAYVSGLPKATLEERVQLARDWVDRGYRAVKYATVVSHEGIVAEMRALREALGEAADLMVDLHWKFDGEAGTALVRELAAYGPYFVEAPCAPEDVVGLARVAREGGVPVAAGEEWRNVHEARLRVPSAGLAIVQPEMAHTGVSQFVAIARLAEAHGLAVVPHATIGVGIFMAASLQAAATLPDVPYHEYQPSVFDRNLAHVDTTMAVEPGFYRVPAGPGLGTVPRESLWRFRVEGPEWR